MKIYDDQGRQTPEATAFAWNVRRLIQPLFDQALNDGANIRELAHLLDWEIKDMELSTSLNRQMEVVKVQKAERDALALGPVRPITVPARNDDSFRWNGGLFTVSEASIAKAAQQFGEGYKVEAIKTIRNANNILLKDAKDIVEFLFDQGDTYEKDHAAKD